MFHTFTRRKPAETGISHVSGASILTRAPGVLLVPKGEGPTTFEAPAISHRFHRGVKQVARNLQGAHQGPIVKGPVRIGTIILLAYFLCAWNHADN